MPEKKDISPQAFKKDGKSFTIIFDSSNTGQKNLEAISKLIDFMEGSKSQIYSNISVIIPLQTCGIEKKKKTSKGILKENLQNQNGNTLHKFYQKHKDIIDIVETDISRSFKFFYSQQNLPTIEKSPQIRETILSRALYTLNNSQRNNGTITTLKAMEETLSKFKDNINEYTQQYKAKFENRKQTTLELAAQEKWNEEETQQKISKLEKIIFARAAKKIFKSSDLKTEYLFQAIFENRELNRLSSKNKKFTDYRADKGEMAINNIIERKLRKQKLNTSTMVISEDINAREELMKIRSDHNANVFAISEYGLALCMKKLGLIENLIEVASKDNIETMEKKPNSKKHKNQLIFSKEVSWAERAAKQITIGEWRDKTHEIYNRTSNFTDTNKIAENNR